MRGAELPVLRVDGGLDAALDAAALRRLGPEQLTSFLQQRRWFGAKGRRPAAVRIADVIPVSLGGYRAAIARLEVELDGRTEHYQLPLAVRPERAGGDETPRAVLARVESGEERGLLHDAVESAQFRRELGAAFERGATFGDASRRWVVEPVQAPEGDRGSGGGPRLPRELPSRVVAAEQSNTSIIYGEQAILKLFRRLEAGVNPDVEIARFLTARARFVHTPTLLGTIAFDSEDAGGLSAVGGMLQQYMAGSRDAWADMLERNRPYFAAPGEDTPAHPTLGDIERLGRITRELHDALASDPSHPEFAPKQASGADIARWGEGTRRSVDDAMALLADRLAAGAIPSDRVSEAKVLVRRREAFHEHVSRLMNAVGTEAGALIRHHGDYHLGQVLRTRDGDFMIIDFEGEPARPLAERRERNSALRDVAGMLRSLAYAAATLATEQRNAARPHVLELRAARWERDGRAAFLQGYLGGEAAAFLPGGPEQTEALLALFETEKVFYEMSYELNNRPDWVWIPMRGVSKLLVAPPVPSPNAAGRR